MTLVAKDVLVVVENCPENDQISRDMYVFMSGRWTEDALRTYVDEHRRTRTVTELILGKKC